MYEPQLEFAQNLSRHAARKARQRLGPQYLHEAFPRGFCDGAQNDGGRDVLSLCREILRVELCT